MSVAFSPDGKTIAAGYAPQAAAAWCCGTWPRANAWSTTPRREGGRRYGAWPSAPTARPSRQDHLGGDVGGVVLWDVARRKRLATTTLAVKEGDVMAWPSAPTARPSRPDTTARRAAAWCCGTWPREALGGRAPHREGGQCQ